MLGNLVDCDPDDVAVGTRVRVVFDHVTEETPVARFAPV